MHLGSREQQVRGWTRNPLTDNSHTLLSDEYCCATCLLVDSRRRTNGATSCSGVWLCSSYTLTHKPIPVSVSALPFDLFPRPGVKLLLVSHSATTLLIVVIIRVYREVPCLWDAASRTPGPSTHIGSRSFTATWMLSPKGKDLGPLLPNFLQQSLTQYWLLLILPTPKRWIWA